MSFLRLGWRNIWRNGKRTGITVTAVALNTAILITCTGLVDGMLAAFIENITRMVTGDVQVHAEGYRSERSFYQTIPDPAPILESAERAGIQAAPRSYGFGLISSGTKSAGALYWGVAPETERKAFQLAREIEEGRYLSAAAGREIVIGRKLSRSLQVEVGSEVVAVVQAADGSLGNELFRVVGILRAVSEEIDRGAAILHRQDFDELFVAKGRLHEIALNAWGRIDPEEVRRVVAGAKPAGAGLEILTWKQLFPQLGRMVDIFWVALWIFGMIFFLAAGLGVMNTMLMATYERIREFGVLKAIGTTPWRIVRDVATEAALLGLVATILGAAAGMLATWYFQLQGIDLRTFATGNVTMSGVAFDYMWYAKLDSGVVGLPVVVMWLSCVLASLYPAAKAARLDPVRAMTHV